MNDNNNDDICKKCGEYFFHCTCYGQNETQSIPSPSPDREVGGDEEGPYTMADLENDIHRLSQSPSLPADKSAGEDVAQTTAWTNKVYRILQQTLEACADRDNVLGIRGRIEASHQIAALFDNELSSLRTQIQSLTEERDVIKQAYEEQKAEKEKLRDERNFYRNQLEIIGQQTGWLYIQEILKQYPSQQ